MCSCAGLSTETGTATQRPLTLSLERLRRLVAQNAPILYMHPSDRFMPCSVEWFMDNSELWLTTPGNAEEGTQPAFRQLLKQGDVTGCGIAAAQKQHPSNQLQLRLHPSAKCGPPLEEINATPLYANAKWVTRSDGAPEALEINYLTFYAHNGWYDIGYLGLLKVGAHDGDWEHLTVRLDASEGALQGVYYNAHRSRDGCWVPAHEVEKTAEGRIIAYVARHGHGTYPKAGIWWRAGMMANDLTSSSGAVWCPHTCYLLPCPAVDKRAEAAVPLSAEATSPMPAIPEASLSQPSLSPRSKDGSLADGASPSGPSHKTLPAGVAESASCPGSSAAGITSAVSGQHSGQHDSRHLADQPAHLIAQGPGLSELEAVVNVLPAPTAQTMGRAFTHGSSRGITVLRVPSRGSSLPVPLSPAEAFSGAGVEVLEHSGEWLEYLGQWGTTPSPAAQDWFWTAEPPVSRGVVLRIVGHLWPETRRI